MTFEEWAISELMEGGSDPMAFRKDVLGRYKDGPLQVAYRAWEATTKAEREACAMVCDVAEMNGKGAHYAAEAIRMRSNT